MYGRGNLTKRRARRLSAPGPSLSNPAAGNVGAARGKGAPTLQELRALRALILGIAATHGASKVRIFGSVARGQARPDSDVDFLVDFEPDRTVLDLSGLILDLQEALGRDVDVVESWQLSPRSAGIKREAVPL